MPDRPAVVRARLQTRQESTASAGWCNGIPTGVSTLPILGFASSAIVALVAQGGAPRTFSAGLPQERTERGSTVSGTVADVSRLSVLSSSPALEYGAQILSSRSHGRQPCPAERRRQQYGDGEGEHDATRRR
jgi:hypothetical protein